MSKESKYCDRCGGFVGEISLLIYDEVWCKGCFIEKFGVDMVEYRKVVRIENFESLKENLWVGNNE